MSITVDIFAAPTDLAPTVVNSTTVELDWSNALPIYNFANGGAEAASMIGWTSTLGKWGTRGPGNAQAIANPKEGTHVFWASGAGTTARSLARQRISPLSMGLLISDIVSGRNFTLKYWPGSMDGTASESIRMSVYFYDSTGALLASHVPAYTLPGVAPATPVNTAIWASEETDTYTMPSGTCFVDVELDGLRNNGVSDDAVVDNVRITVSSPGSFLVPGYAIYRDGSLIDNVAADIVTYTDTTLLAGVHTYKVVAYDGTNFLSGDSNIVTVDTTITRLPVPNAFGAFAFDAVFPPVLLVNVKGIKPRIYTPLENNIVRARP